MLALLHNVDLRCFVKKKLRTISRPQNGVGVQKIINVSFGFFWGRPKLIQMCKRGGGCERTANDKRVPDLSQRMEPSPNVHSM